MIETMDGVPIGRRSARQRLEQRGIRRFGEGFDLYPHVARADHIEDLSEQRDRLPVAKPNFPNLRQREVSDRTDTVDVGVVVNHDRAVSSGVNVELDAVGIEEHRPPKGRQGVLELVARSAAVGDDARMIHSPLNGRWGWCP